MNRQQRRKLDRMNATEAKYLKEIQDRQDHIDDKVVMLHMCVYALAMYDLGYDVDEIENTIQGANAYLCSVDGENVNYYTLMRDLKDKTGIEFKWA